MKTSFRLMFACTIALNSFVLSTNAQNLVPDPGFENFTEVFCGIMGPAEFDQTMVNWINPNLASPQMYFVNNDPSCFNHQPNSTYSGPFGLKGSQSPFEGNAMAGLWCYTIEGLNQRQYVQTELTEPLEVGESYAISFYVSLADAMEFGIDRLGATLSTSPITASNDGPIAATPQVEAEETILNIEDWVLIADTIIAEESYTYLTIGNFYSDAMTATTSNPEATGEVSTYGAFYFVDQVMVQQADIVSVDDLEESKRVEVYPTIFESMVTLKTMTNGICEIYSVAGRLVHHEVVQEGVHQMDLSGLSEGTYLVSIVSKEGIFTKRLVK